jgi:hypothetical protein
MLKNLQALCEVYCTRCRVVGCDSMLESLRLRFRSPMKSLNPSLTQSLAQMSTKNFPCGRGVKRSRCAKLTTAICEQILQKVWDSRYLTNIWASMTCYKDSLLIHSPLHGQDCCDVGLYLWIKKFKRETKTQNWF